MEQVHTAYQKMGKRCQMMEHEVENLTKDKQELQEKFSEKSRQKRKLDEMYDQLRSEYESVKRTAIQPANNFYPRHQEPDFFSNPVVNMMENREPTRKELQTGRFTLLQYQNLKMRYGQQDRTVQNRVHSTSPAIHPLFQPTLETEEQEEDMLWWWRF